MGTGAMALLLGARLSPNANITLLGSWKAGLTALEDRGIRLHDNGEVSESAVTVARSPADCEGAELSLVLVKSWQTDRAAEMLNDCLAPEGIALTLQNGLGNIETLSQKLGIRRAALGVTTTGATLLGPGEVRAGGSGPIHVAEHPRLEPLVSLLEAADFEVELAHDVESMLWGKLAVNAGINPLTALLEVPNGELLERSDARSLMNEAAREVARVAEVRGVRLPYDDAGEQAEIVARATVHNESSMLQDIRRGAPTEIDAICGAVAAEADRQRISAELNRTLWKLVRAKVDRK